MVKLPGPSRVVAVLARDGVGEGGADARVGAGVAGDLACERGEQVVDGAGDVPPALDRLEERKADRLAGGGVTPRTSGERLDAYLELAVVGGEAISVPRI